MAVGVHFEGDFLDVYPYMDWIFLLNHDGDLLYSRTDTLLDQDVHFHDFMFRQSANKLRLGWKKPSDLIVNIPTSGFKRLTSVADKNSFCDLRFFYSKIFCGSEDGLEWISFDTKSEEAGKANKVSDAPISSIAAKYMTVFAASLEEKVLTLFGVDEEGIQRTALTGQTASRVSVSNDTVNYYYGSRDLTIAPYAKSAAQGRDIHEEGELPKRIDSIGDGVDFAGNVEDIDFIFNSNDGLYFLRGNELEYKKSDGSTYIFKVPFEGRPVRAHTLRGAKCIEFIEGLMALGKTEELLLRGECISTRGYANSVNYKHCISATNEDGAFVFRLE